MNLKDLSTVPEFILYTTSASFGDNCMMQSLPRLLFQKYGKKSFVSNKIPYHVVDTKNFLWGRNPFVAGFTDKAWTIEIPYSELTYGVWAADWVMPSLDL